MSDKLWFCSLVASAVLLLPASTAQAVTIATVPVGNLGNAGELAGQSVGGVGPDRICGAVDYAYSIGKYEVTAGQYSEFLNAVAATDTYGLYNEGMYADDQGCKIRRTGTSGSYDYLVDYDSDGNEDADWVNRPVTFVSWGDAARFANWLHNGQPTGAQDLSTTEDGSYYLNGATTDAALLAVGREADWKWAIPTEDEWYKAAYHKNDGMTGNYFDYPTQSNYPNVPSNTLTDPDLGNNATFKVGTAFTIGSPYYRTEVGAHEESDSSYGTFDQGGNVLEWNEAIVYNGRGVGGGSFSSDNRFLHASMRFFLGQTSEFVYTGFRVASVPPLPGDMNGDWEVNHLDIVLFIDHLLAGSYELAADMNEDGLLTGLDIDLFVDVVAPAAVQPVPEPTALALAVAGLTGLAGWLFGCRRYGR